MKLQHEASSNGEKRELLDEQIKIFGQIKRVMLRVDPQSQMWNETWEKMQRDRRNLDD